MKNANVVVVTIILSTIKIKLNMSNYSYNTLKQAKNNSYDLGLRQYMVNVYKYMSISLLLTALVAIVVSSSVELMYAIHVSGLRWIIF